VRNIPNEVTGLKRGSLRLVSRRIGAVVIAGLFIFGGYQLVSSQLFYGYDKTEVVREYDLDRDGQTEHYVLKAQQLTVTKEGQEIWQSSADWQVTGFVLADATNDGRDDLLLVVWKPGSFGRDKPFWISVDDQRLSNHLFVLDLIQGKLRPVWFSSALDRPIQALEVNDIESDGKNELVVQEERSWWDRIRERRVPSEESITYWQWKSWGFYQVKGDNEG